MKIVKLSIQRPIYVTVLFILLTVLGYLSFKSLSAELMPKFTPPLLNVQIIYPGASPSEVENSLTQKAEEVLSSMEGIDQMQSYSFEGMSMIMVSFDFGTDIDKAMTEGWSTATNEVRNMGFGAGMGLPNMKRNADGFDIVSAVGVGTHITMTFDI